MSSNRAFVKRLRKESILSKKQKDGRYRSKIVVSSGEKPIWISARTLQELESKKREIREKYIGDSRPRTTTFHALVIEWFEQIKKPCIQTRSTLANYQNAIYVHLLPCFPEKQLIQAVRRTDLQRCLDACAGMSVTPCRLVRSVMSHVMKYALAEKLITHDPSIALYLPKSKKSKNKKAFTTDQREKLLQTASQSADGIMICLLYFTGIRRGEMLGLKWGDFDWENHLIHIQRSIDLSSHSISSVKSSASNRYIPVPMTLETFLAPLKGASDQWVLPGKNNLPMTASEFRLRWNRLMIQAGFAFLSPEYYAKAERVRTEGGIPKPPHPARSYVIQLTPHWFRHNYITACVAAGIPSEVTMRIVGHSSYQTTINIYTHLQKEHLQKAAASLEEVFKEEVAEKLPFLPGVAE